MQESVSMNARKCVHECKKVCPWMQESVSMNARKCVHECKKVCPCTKALPQSGIRAWIKQGRRKRKKRGRETEARRLMERKAAQQNKTHLRNENKAYPGTAQVSKAGVAPQIEILVKRKKWQDVTLFYRSKQTADRCISHTSADSLIACSELTPLYTLIAR